MIYLQAFTLNLNANEGLCTIIHPLKMYQFNKRHDLVSITVLQSTVQINKKIEYKIVNIFLPISFNIFFWCSKEPSH